MKAIFLFLISISGFSQIDDLLDISVDLSQDYKKCEIFYLDGKVEEGFIYGFIKNKKVHADVGNMLDFSSIENTLNLNDNKFEFKKDLNDKAIRLSQKEINEIKIFSDDNKYIHYKLMQLATANSRGQIINLKKQAWLPYYKKDKINIFSYDVVEKINNKIMGEKIMTVVYLNDPSNNIAINTIDFNRINLFNIGKLDDKLDAVFKEIFKSCPDFINKNSNSKGFWNLETYFNNSDEYDSKRKNVKKDKTLTKKERMIKIDELDTEEMIIPYVRLIDAYKENSCKIEE